MLNLHKDATYRKRRIELLSVLFEESFSNRMRDDSGFDPEEYPECVALEDPPECIDTFQ